MPAYPSADALISDALLRLDTLGPNKGVIVVEGPNDKRVLVNRVHNRQQIIASGGRKLLLSSHSVAKEKNCEGILFLADCDYDIPLKLLTPHASLVITEHVDLEADLLFYGGWQRLVGHLVPAALDDDERLESITSAVLTRTVALADAIGRYRRVARELAFKAAVQVRYGKYRRQGTELVDEPKLVRALWQNSQDDCPLTHSELAERMRSIDSSYDNCNGHDLAAIMAYVLRDDYGVRGHSPETVEDLLRHGIPPQEFEEWSVIRRIKLWEKHSRRLIVADSG